MQKRKIIHVDMDAFFASVEQRDFPEYRGKPLVVGGQPNSRGVVAACSYEARTFGIHSAMSSSVAYKRCPQAIFVAPRFEVYRQVSANILNIFKQYTEIIEPLSLDEAYLDVSFCTEHHGSATLIAQAIRRQIFTELNLTASAGISYNKFLAKVASDENKPNGQKVILPKDAQNWLHQLPIGRFYGIGKVTEKRMKALGIKTGMELGQQSRIELIKHFGKSGAWYYDIVRGIDNRSVGGRAKRRSIGIESTFQQDLFNIEQMLEKLYQMSDKLSISLKKKQLYAKTLTLKVKYPNFKIVTRSHSYPSPFNDSASIRPWLKILLERTSCEKLKVRLLGLSVSNLSSLDDSSDQLPLY